MSALGSFLHWKSLSSSKRALNIREGLLKYQQTAVHSALCQMEKRSKTFLFKSMSRVTLRPTHPTVSHIHVCTGLNNWRVKLTLRLHIVPELECFHNSTPHTFSCLSVQAKKFTIRKEADQLKQMGLESFTLIFNFMVPPPQSTSSCVIKLTDNDKIICFKQDSILLCILTYWRPKWPHFVVS